MFFNRVFLLSRNMFIKMVPLSLSFNRSFEFIAKKYTFPEKKKMVNRYLTFKAQRPNSIILSRYKAVMSNPSNFNFRSAKDEDMSCIIDMIKDLAKFEKMTDSCKLNADDLIRDAGNGLCHIYVMEDLNKKNLAGYAICYFSYSTWEGKAYFLEDLYLRPEYRGSGTGELMFRKVAEKAHSFGCKRLEFHVLEWNPARRFYNRLGCTDLTETERWHYYRLNEAQLCKMADELKKQQPK